MKLAFFFPLSLLTVKNTMTADLGLPPGFMLTQQFLLYHPCRCQHSKKKKKKRCFGLL